VILDSYGSHLKLDVEHLTALYKIHIIFIPPNMTGILQPLDVATNRSYQQYFDDQYEKYLDTAMNSTSNDMTYYTKKGSIKIPSYNMVVDWSVQWAYSFDGGKIRKAFESCCIGCSDSEKYHTKLKQLLNHKFDLDRLILENDEYVDDAQIFDFNGFENDELFIKCNSFYECLSNFVHDTCEVILEFIKEHLKKR